ncbi:glycosyltransferase [Patescibacteria group bacterium]|nr:glycosyltransferase [Patescibacteria group bacterium]
MKVALVHDYFNQYGGGERVVEAMHEVWPDAAVYTSIYDEDLMRGWLNIPRERIKTNLIQKLPFSKSLSKHYFFLYPLAFRLQDVGEADVVISSSSYAAKFVRVKPGGLHICYMHTPPRFLWGYDTELSRYYAKSFDRYLEPFYEIVVPPIKNSLRFLDYKAAQGIDYFIANSKEVKKRIKKHYGRDSVVIYPPVDTDRFALNSKKDTRDQDYFLVVSRLGGYKKVDIVVKAFNKSGVRLKIVGDGPQYKFLKEIAKDNVELLGRKNDKETAYLLEGCRALIFPTFEDFGIVPLEAMASGKPVIAYRGGGVLESLVEGVTGEYFDEQTPNAIIKAVKNFQSNKYDSKACRAQAKKFSVGIFKQNMKSFVEEAWQIKKDSR